MINSFTKTTTDVLVVGSGIAGMSAAIKAKQCGADVAIVTKLFPTRSQSCCAKGGINVCLSEEEEKDLIEETLESAKGLSSVDNIKFVASYSKKILDFFLSTGTPFSREIDGTLKRKKFGGQKTEKTCFVKSSTGFFLMQSLYEQVIKNKIKIYDNIFITDLIYLKKEQKFCGAVGFNTKDKIPLFFNAKNTIIATGGGASIYKTSSNSNYTTGDGFALALNANIPLKNIEMIQFHPTGIYGSGILVSESIRADGAFLINSNEKKFMKNYSPLKDLAPRDVITKAILNEIKEGRGCGKNRDQILLDCRHLNVDESDSLKDTATMLNDFFNINMKKDLIPIYPTAHYFMGGVEANKNGEATINSAPVKGLFVAGEVACADIHGANRLGGNSLLEAAVFGAVAGESSAKNFTSIKLSTPKTIDKNLNINSIFQNKKTLSTLSCLKIKIELKDIMQTYAGAIKTEKGLKKGLKKIEALEIKMEVADKTILEDFFETKNQLLIAKAIIKSSLARKESRGAFMRDDFAKENINIFNIYVSKFEDKIFIKKEKV